jgi:mono/diheme cytochrome c family protein
MVSTMRRACFTLLATALVLPAPLLAQPAGKTEPTFETHVRPILKANCFECHGEGKKLKGGLDLRLRHFLVKGGKSGPALKPGKPADSPILERLRSQEMPPGKKKLTKDEIAVIERWIQAGAPAARPEPKELPLGFSISEDEASHWAFQPLRKVEPPIVKNAKLVRNPIDQFLLAKLEAKGLSFGPEADRTTLIRRATFDLLGLPPTPAEVDAFVKDQAADAYEKLIDRLLASPQYGERWGRHWLDVAGYADSEGYTGADPVRKTAYRYRDYVIRSINADRPWDQLVVEQLAGDEMVRPPYEKLPPAELDKLIATGFLRMAPDGTASPGVNQKAVSNQNVADTLQIVSSSLLGLTLQCAQCHNHRYDPIPQVDYYHVRAIFEPALNTQNWRTPAGREVPLFKDEDRKKADEIEKEAVKIDQERTKKQDEYIEATFQKELAKLPKELHEPIRIARTTPGPKRSAEQQKLLMAHPSVNVSAGSLYLYDSKAAADLKTYADKAAKLRATKPTPDFIRALTEIPGQVPATRLFERGDYEQPTDAVGPAGLMIFERFGVSTIPDKAAGLPSTGRRLAFAKSLTDGRHPLPARVLVNRVWLNHFGKGIVNTPGDFGLLGERPTHPELLDWLAADFMAGGWKTKRVHKLIMMSAAYRQVSTRRPDVEKLDPDNRLLGRMSIRRLEAEAMRDAILAVSGKLNVKAFGPPVPVTHDEVGQVVVGNDIRNPGDGTPMGKVKGLDGEEYRRSVYIQVRRSLPLAVLESFDGPAMIPNCDIRHTSTVATQALMLMNSRFIHEQAAFLAERVRKEAGADVRAQVALAWRLAYASEPSAKEIDQAATFVQRQTELLKGMKATPGAPPPDVQALTNFAQALLSANRFLYVD